MKDDDTFLSLSSRLVSFHPSYTYFPVVEHIDSVIITVVVPLLVFFLQFMEPDVGRGVQSHTKDKLVSVWCPRWWSSKTTNCDSFSKIKAAGVCGPMTAACKDHFTMIHSQVLCSYLLISGKTQPAWPLNVTIMTILLPVWISLAQVLSLSVKDEDSASLVKLQQKPCKNID